MYLYGHKHALIITRHECEKLFLNKKEKVEKTTSMEA